MLLKFETSVVRARIEKGELWYQIGEARFFIIPQVLDLIKEACDDSEV